jgi:phosphate transport system protein
MPREHFHEALEGLELDLLEMGELAVRSIGLAMEALVHHDEAKAIEVIADDDGIDAKYLEIDQGIFEILALQTPVAGDLRLLSTILHINPHLERIGDHAVNFAKILRLTKTLPTEQTILIQIEEMGHLAQQIVRTAMEAFARRDLELCLKLPKMDDPLDRLNRGMYREVARLADDPASLDWGMHMNIVARGLERVGDNAVDIGEQVGFLLTGEFREFTDASHVVKAADAE